MFIRKIFGDMNKSVQTIKHDKYLTNSLTPYYCASYWVLIWPIQLTGAFWLVLVVKKPPANAGNIKRCGFNPWVGKIPWRRAWQPTPVFLPGESSRTEKPGRLQSIGSQRAGHNWSKRVSNSAYWERYRNTAPFYHAHIWCRTKSVSGLN